MNRWAKKFLCPGCFQRHPLAEVEFRCTSGTPKCRGDGDKLFMDFWRRSPLAKGRVFAQASSNGLVTLVRRFWPRETSECPECRFPSTLRLCPTCHSELPASAGRGKQLIFGVIGAKESGKSHYVATLIHAIEREMSTAFHSNLHPTSDETILRYRDDFKKHVFDHRVTIPATVSASADRRVRMPLIYELQFLARRGTAGITHAATLSFFDTAGEDLDAEDTMRVENKYIFNSDGLILLLDPLQLDAVRTKVAGRVRLPRQNTETKEIVSRVANLIRRAKSLTGAQKIDIPVALAFSKSDAIANLLPPGHAAVQSPWYGEGAFRMDDFEDSSRQIEALVDEWNPQGIIHELRANFSRHGVFSCSALGCEPEEDTRIPRLQPFRVLDPFLWLLAMNRLIPTIRARRPAR